MLQAAGLAPLRRCLPLSLQSADGDDRDRFLLAQPGDLAKPACDDGYPGGRQGEQHAGHGCAVCCQPCQCRQTRPAIGGTFFVAAVLAKGGEEAEIRGLSVQVLCAGLSKVRSNGENIKNDSDSPRPDRHYESLQRPGYARLQGK